MERTYTGTLIPWLSPISKCRTDGGFFSNEFSEEQPELDQISFELDDVGAVPELPPLSHTGLTSKQQENRRLMIGRHVAYVGPQSTASVPFLVGRVVAFD